MTGKENLKAILDGQVPDSPPHWELNFLISKEMLGIDLEAIEQTFTGSEKAKKDLIQKKEIEIRHRLIDEYDWAAAPCFSPQLTSLYKKEFGDKALIAGFDWDGVLWTPTFDDLMNFVEQLFDAPGELHAEARQKCEIAKKRLTLYADNGADFFVLAHDFGFNDATFVSPDHFREFMAPYLAEVVQHAHALGKKALLHSDGCLTQILDQLHATGLDGYQSVDPQGHMDIREVREQYPEWILMGNVACNMLQDADEQKIRESVRYCMTHGGVGKPYIFSTSNCIFNGMPPQSYEIMLDEYNRILNEARMPNNRTVRRTAAP